MKLLVTGGAGFIGSNFIHYWLKRYPDDKVVNLDKLTYAGNLENLKGLDSNPNYQFIRGDIANREDVEQAIDGVDVIVNFAAESHVDRSIIDAAPFITTNIVGTYILLQSAVNHKVSRFHHISTDEVFGALKLNSSQKFNEKTKYNPRTPYAASKAASDHLVRAYFETYKLPVTISNCSNNFGPYQYPEKLIPLAITNLMENKKVPIYGDGLYVRDWLYVEDHCRAIELILTKGRDGETYCIGAGNEFPNIEIVRKIIKFLGLRDDMVEYVEDRPAHDRRYAIDATKIKKELDWEPKYNFDEALRLTVSWYQENIDWWQKLKRSKYFNDYSKYCS